MDFLDHCERAAGFARQESELRERLRAARANGETAEVARLTDALEGATIERRFAVLRALDHPRPAAPTA